MTTQGIFYMDEFKQYSQFGKVAKMDEHIRKVLAQFAALLNNTDNAVMDYIKQHATRAVGVAYVRVQVIADAIGKSYRTVSSSTAKLQKLGIIAKYEVMRLKNGGNGANIYVINAAMPTAVPTIKLEIRKSGSKTAEQPVQPTELPNDLPTDAEGEKLNGASVEPPQCDPSNSFKSSFKSSLKSLENIEKGERTYAHEKSLEDRKPDVELFADIPKNLQVSLRRLDDNRYANSLWKKIVQAFVHSALYTKLYTLQEQCEDEAFLGELYAKVHNAIANFRAGEVKDLDGYLYVTTKNYFNEVKEELDVRHAFLNAEIEEDYTDYNDDTNDENDLYELFPYLKDAHNAIFKKVIQSCVPSFDYGNKAELDELGVY